VAPRLWLPTLSDQLGRADGGRPCFARRGHAPSDSCV